MTPIAFALNGTLMLLLLFALAVGLKLERRLRGLRDSQANFAKAAVELNAAIARAEVGLNDIRTAMRDAEDTLTERVDEARAAAKKLEQAINKIPAVPAEPAPVVRELVRLAAAPAAAAAAPAPAQADVDDMAGLPIKDLLARLRGAQPLDGAPAQPATRTTRQPAAAAVPAADAARSRARVDDDLFEAADAFPSLRRAGAAR